MILGVRFYTADLEGLLDRVERGGLVVAPSAPVMTRLTEDPAHRAALEGADLAVTDSSLMVLLWLARTGERLTRISAGLRATPGPFCGRRRTYRAPGESFWVMPSAADAGVRQPGLAYSAQGYPVGDTDAYVAPRYPREGPHLGSGPDRSRSRPDAPAGCHRPQWRWRAGTARVGPSQEAFVHPGDPLRRRRHRLPFGTAVGDTGLGGPDGPGLADSVRRRAPGVFAEAKGRPAPGAAPLASRFGKCRFAVVAGR